VWPNQQIGDVVLKDFGFGSAEVLSELKLHYRTLGSLKRNAAGEVINAVLLLHGTGGTWKNWMRRRSRTSYLRAEHRSAPQNTFS
jgi:homoserine O-acetyltransferase